MRDNVLEPSKALSPEFTGKSRRENIALIVLAIILFSTAALALSSGAVPLSIPALLDGSAKGLEVTIFSEIRAPRVLLSGLVGASLAAAGAVLQGLFRNPLADPGLIGVSSGAALGAVSMIVFGATLNLPDWIAVYSMPLAAIIGAMGVTFFLYTFSNYYGHFSVVTVLLVGIAINALASVGIGAFQYLSDDAQLRSLVFWMMGSFGRTDWITVIPAVSIMLLSILVLIKQSSRLDRLQLGEAQAFHLGINVKKLKRTVILVSACAVGAGVALSGIIGFVGLVVPHLVRLLFGVSHRILIPGSALLGACLMISADLVSRIVIVPSELPVGLVTSALGAPFFLWLIARARA